MKTYALLQCVGWPILLIWILLLRINKTVLRFLTPTLERHALAMLRPLFVIFRAYIGFNSLIIAICRYCFIVFDQAISSFGIGKARKVLLFGSFGIPLLLAILREAAFPMAPGWISLSTAENSIQSPLYYLAHSFLPDFVSYGMALLVISLVGIIFLNIGEGLIYLHIYIYGRR